MQPYYEENGVTIYHGDCREVVPSISGVELLLTDPPYGVNHNTRYSRFSGGKGFAHLRNDHAPVYGDASPFDPAEWLGYPRVVLFGANCYSDKLPLGTWFVWDKRTTAGGTILSDAEVAWFSRGHGIYIFNHCWSGFARASETGEHYHPTQKPVALMRWCIERAGGDGLILDPYMGSGSTLRAAKDAGRKAIGIEVDERYCEVAANRLRQEVLQFS
jgi:DNA modification methylase